MKKIIMITGDSCMNCKRAKAMFEGCPVDVDLEVISVDKDTHGDGYRTTKEETQALMREYNSTVLPTLFIERDSIDEKAENPKYHVFRGFDNNLGEIQTVLGI